MIYLSGDIHGDVNRVSRDIGKYGITKNDIIILLGDVGLNFIGFEKSRMRKEFLNCFGIPIFCIHGNHEIRPETLPSYYEKVWHGGIVYVEDSYPNLLFAKDGELFDLDGYITLVIGGAYSVDKYYRLSHGYPWFADEQPYDVIKKRVESNLEAHGWIVNIVLSHTCPKKYIPTEAFLPGLDQSNVDRSTEKWLGKIEEKLTYGDWYCGHWHIDKRVDKVHFMMYSYETLSPMKPCRRLRIMLSRLMRKK